MSRRKPNGFDATAINITRPPGLVGQLVDHGERCTPHVTRWPALIGSLVGFAAATRNGFVVRVGPDNHIPVNLYGAEIGDTASGKESGIRNAKAIAHAASVSSSTFASAEGLHRALAAEPKDGANPKARLLVQDEWGRALQQIKSDKAGHQRAVMTRAMECYGLAFGGILDERSYSKAKDLLPAVKNPFLCCLFATTPSTLLEALTSAEVVDGTLNRILVLHLDPDPPLRDLEDIHNSAIPDKLAAMIRRASNLELEPAGEKAPGAFMPPVKQKTFRDLSTVERGGQCWNVVEATPGAITALKEFREHAAQRVRSDQDLGALWSRAFENAARVAGVIAVGEACIDYGPLVLSEPTAAWAAAFTHHCIETTVSRLRDNLADTPAESTRLRIMHHAWKLSEDALGNPSPTVENTAPPDKQDEIRTLKRAGWFPKSALVRRSHHKGCSSRDLAAELLGLVEAELMAAHAVEWKASTGRREKREFFRPLPDE